ncbi:MAG TPA: DUF72 domain-containing protein [Myxococcaceae bacterium]|nr:DUF72 domain-containing protein [Myxococcaceae bacterium]
MSPAPQLELFAPAPGVAAEPELPPGPPAPAPVAEGLRELGGRLPGKLRLGTSSWSFPGWTGLVYAREASPDLLAREGLPAYARHPLFRTVGVDRTFHGPVPVETFRAWADAVPDDFRFLVKAHQALTLPRFPVHERYGARRGEDNPTFLDPAYARDAVVAPLVEGLGVKAGPLVFQFPPQDVQALGGPSAFADRLHAFLAALPAGPLYAVELRNRELYTTDVADVLEDVGTIPVLAGWRHLPPLPQQAWRLRARAASALVVRWMLPPELGYEEARELYAPFDRLVNEDPAVRGDIAGLAVEALAEGRPVYVTINNKAEGSAPVSVERLAVAVVARLSPPLSLPAGPESVGRR